MKIQCLTKNIKEAVIIAEKSTAKNQTLPVLSALFLGVEKDNIKIRSTNLETAIELVITGKVLDNGSVIVPAKTLSMFLSGVSDDQIILESKKNNLFIKTKTTETTIRGYPQEDFPIFPKIDPQEKFKISSPELKNALASVVVATSQSDIKPELNSVFFKIFKNTLKIVATDSFRLAEKIITSKNISSEKLILFLVPQRAILEILKLLDKDEEIEVGINKTQLLISSPSYKFISRLTDGSFPEYEQIIPKNFNTITLVKKADILNELKLASVFVGRLNDVVISLHSDKKAVGLMASPSDAGEHNAWLEASIQGKSISAKFNWKYLLDGIYQIDQEYISLNFNNGETPVLVKGKGDNSYTYLVMPMRGSV